MDNECEHWIGSSGKVNTECGVVADCPFTTKDCPFCNNEIYRHSSLDNSDLFGGSAHELLPRIVGEV